MQVNLMHHPNAFADLDEAFDPAANARYAVTFLSALYQQTQGLEPGDGLVSLAGSGAGRGISAAGVRPGDDADGRRPGDHRRQAKRPVWDVAAAGQRNIARDAAAQLLVRGAFVAAQADGFGLNLTPLAPLQPGCRRRRAADDTSLRGRSSSPRGTLLRRVLQRLAACREARQLRDEQRPGRARRRSRGIRAPTRRHVRVVRHEQPVRGRAAGRPGRGLRRLCSRPGPAR